MTQNPIPRLATLAAATLSTMAFAACGGSDDGSSSVDMADAFPSAAVCNGEAHEGAPADGPDATGYVYLSEGDGWTSAWFDTFGDDQAVVGDDADLILCVTVASSTEAERCPFEDDGETFTLVMMEATYDVELRRAATASVVGRDTLSAPAEECPMITSWTSGEGERRSYPQPTDGLRPLVDTFFG